MPVGSRTHPKSELPGNILDFMVRTGLQRDCPHRAFHHPTIARPLPHNRPTLSADGSSRIEPALLNWYRAEFAKASASISWLFKYRLVPTSQIQFRSSVRMTKCPAWAYSSLSKSATYFCPGYHQIRHMATEQR